MSTPASPAPAGPSDSPATVGTVLGEPEWRARAAAHADRIDALVGPYLAERRRGRKHAVIDFLFTYYSARPIQVRRWHPGFGIGLEDGDEYLALQGYARRGGVVAVTEEFRDRRASAIGAIVESTSATASRPARFGCFGLHEWAMVYRTPETRHAIPLRLGAAGTDAVVESMPLRCTHYDAFRFFTPDAVPRNANVLTRDDQIRHEQPGCLHATMDLYRHCLKLGPLVPGELLADAFELALDARTLDMRASPYDLTALGYDPVPIETPRGRAEYLRQQTALAERGTALRARVAERCRGLLETVVPTTTDQ
ncbi:MAG: 3-methyladenine DNA glycosylase [Gordonia sp. (in: high G+C Gram-positive bacteria)]|uniref:3-methyladenine DNA glycosylase n=1 Tax=Gordonia sp. (in: high G+C Gram-positive bacteria) TaxID=84139 RepID=UPI0039E66E8D